MMHFKKTITAVMLVVSLAVCTAPAQACCGDGEAAAAGAEVAGAGIKAVILASTAAIQGWMERMVIAIGVGFGKVTAEIMKQTAAMRVMEEGKIAVRARNDMEYASANAAVKYGLSPRACFESAGGTAVGVATGESRETVSDLNRNFTDRTLFTPNTSAVIGKLYDTHTKKYCSQGDAAQGRCAQPATAELQNADIHAGTTLNVSRYTPQQAEAAQAFVNNVVNPIPTQNIPKDWEKTPQGQAFIAGQHVEQARLSIAANSLNTAVAARVPVKGLGSAALLDKADVSEMELLESQIRC